MNSLLKFGFIVIRTTNFSGSWKLGTVYWVNTMSLCKIETFNKYGSKWKSFEIINLIIFYIAFTYHSTIIQKMKHYY